MEVIAFWFNKLSFPNKPILQASHFQAKSDHGMECGGPLDRLDSLIGSRGPAGTPDS
jgi:hypothetical protein